MRGLRVTNSVGAKGELWGGGLLFLVKVFLNLVGMEISYLRWGKCQTTDLANRNLVETE